MKALRFALMALGALALLAALALAFALHAAHASGWALAVIALTGLAAWVYLSPRLMAWRYIVPGGLAAALFIVFPMAYTVGISFTNYSGEHLLSFERATEVLLARGQGDGRSMAFTLESLGGDSRRLHAQSDDGHRYASAPFRLGGTVRLPLQDAPGDASPAPAADLRTLAAQIPALRRVTALLPDGSEMRLLSLRRLAVERPAYVREADGSLRATASSRPMVNVNSVLSVANVTVHANTRMNGW
jgi:maltose/maltodextrin transport system permease protein